VATRRRRELASSLFAALDQVPQLSSRLRGEGRLLPFVMTDVVIAVDRRVAGNRRHGRR
jgi:hypothetical protein